MISNSRKKSIPWSKSKGKAKAKYRAAVKAQPDSTLYLIYDSDYEQYRIVNYNDLDWYWDMEVVMGEDEIINPRKRKNPGCRDGQGFVPTPACRGQAQAMLLFFHEMKRSDPKFTLKDAWEISKGHKPVTKLSKKTLAKAKRDAPVVEQTVLAFNPRKRKGHDHLEQQEWKDSAEHLLKKNQGKTQKAFHYRVYLRAVIMGNEGHATHMSQNFEGSKQAQEDLIDHYGRRRNPPGKRKNADHRPDEQYGKLKGVLPSEYLRGKPAHDADFIAGYRAGQKAYRKQKDLPRRAINTRYRKVHNKYGSWWINGFQTANSNSPSPVLQSIAVKLGLAHGKWNPRKRKNARKEINAYSKRYTLTSFSEKYFGKNYKDVPSATRREFWSDFKYAFVGGLDRYKKETTSY